MKHSILHQGPNLEIFVYAIFRATAVVLYMQIQYHFLLHIISIRPIKSFTKNSNLSRGYQEANESFELMVVQAKK